MALPAIPVGLAALLARILGSRAAASAPQAAARAPKVFNVPPPAFGQGAATSTLAGTGAAGLPALFGLGSGNTGMGGAISDRIPSLPSERPMSAEDMAQINAARRFPTADDNAMTYRARQEADDAVRYRELVDSGRLDRANFQDENAIPNPNRTITPTERRDLAASTRTPPLPPVRRPEPGPSVSSLWDRYNETGNPADFILADRAMREAGITGTGEPMQRKAGGAVGGNDAALQQALEIIHRLLAERR